jgi:hypothetical protein
MGNRLDSYSKYPSGMREYLEAYGWHFSKNMYEFACTLFKKENPVTKKAEMMESWTKEQIDDMFKKHNIKLTNKFGYDCYYKVNWAKSMFMKTSIDDEIHLIKLVKDCLDNINSFEEAPFTHFYADCIGKGIPIIWEDML